MPCNIEQKRNNIFWQLPFWISLFFSLSCRFPVHSYSFNISTVHHSFADFINILGCCLYWMVCLYLFYILTFFFTCLIESSAFNKNSIPRTGCSQNKMASITILLILIQVGICIIVERMFSLKGQSLTILFRLSVIFALSFMFLVTWLLHLDSNWFCRFLKISKCPDLFIPLEQFPVALKL